MFRAESSFVRSTSGDWPVTESYDGTRMTVRQAGRRALTPLALVTVAILGTDVVFAIDSVPAIFSVTTDPFLVFSSNAFAILGLRSLYFLLAGAVDKFRYLKPGLAALLVFAGIKILLSDIYKMPIPLSLAIIVGLLAVAIGGSVVADRLDRRRERAAAGTVETPESTVAIPSPAVVSAAPATASTARVIAARLGSRAMSRTNTWTILSRLAGNWPSTERLE